MRAFHLGAATVLLAATQPALAQSEWVESGHIAVAEIRALCERVLAAKCCTKRVEQIHACLLCN